MIDKLKDEIGRFLEQHKRESPIGTPLTSTCLIAKKKITRMRLVSRT
jgi:hypothetical protein